MTLIKDFVWQISETQNGKIFLENHEFLNDTRDIGLFISGDFKDKKEEMEFANEIKRKLNGDSK
jgi:hypothetical protein